MAKARPKRATHKLTRPQILERLKAQQEKGARQDQTVNDYMSLLAHDAANQVVGWRFDPYFVMLDELVTERQPTSTADPLLKLYVLHQRAIRIPQEIHPLDADAAMLLAGELRIPAPSWAVVLMKQLREERMTNRQMNLDQALGFTATGKGHTAEIERRQREVFKVASLHNIWGLSLLGTPIKKACFLEAGRMQKLGKDWNKSDYDLVSDLGSNKKDRDDRASELYDKRLHYSETLRQDWYAWKVSMKDPDSPESAFFKAELEKHKAAFLAQFPLD